MKNQQDNPIPNKVITIQHREPVTDNKNIQKLPRDIEICCMLMYMGYLTVSA